MSITFTRKDALTHTLKEKLIIDTSQYFFDTLVISCGTNINGGMRSYQLNRQDVVKLVEYMTGWLSQQ